jgi:hypothetical protein
VFSHERFAFSSEIKKTIAKDDGDGLDVRRCWFQHLRQASG